MTAWRTNKYHAKKVTIDGIVFDSGAEGEFYQYLKAMKETHHIDCHVAVTLPGGVRFRVDFIRWFWHGPKDNLGLKLEAIEVKGVVHSDFRTKRKLFDAHHPLAPLQVFKKHGKRWVNL